LRRVAEVFSGGRMVATVLDVYREAVVSVI
jgi:hypothetical protein